MQPQEVWFSCYISFQICLLGVDGGCSDLATALLEGRRLLFPCSSLTHDAQSQHETTAPPAIVFQKRANKIQST